MDYIYDIETMRNCFTCCIVSADKTQSWQFEISDYKDDSQSFRQWLIWAAENRHRMVGFNNIGFDYPVIHAFITQQATTAEQISQVAQRIISTPWDDRFSNIIYQPAIEQVDLFLIHHFDNAARSTSLKVLEFNMRMDDIEDLPFNPHVPLTPEQIEVLIHYNWHDVQATLMFYEESLNKLKFRKELSDRYGKDFTNFSDAKIGSQIFIQRLEESGIPCFANGKPRQTPRQLIDLNTCIPDYIQFNNQEFEVIHQWLRKQVIKETKGVFKDLNCKIGGITYEFGTGGIHASVEWRSFHSDSNRKIQVRDVASMYPNIAIKNRYYPEHLSERFCEIYDDMFNERKAHKKAGNDNEQAMLKLALNATYGNSNNQFSPFYDPKFTMSVTLTGQLSLAMLCDRLIDIKGLEMIFANTDGICYIVDRDKEWIVDIICDWWQHLTKLELETDEVAQIHVRDCNSYIQEYA